MTASRLVAGKELSNVQWVEVQASWLGVNITEALGGIFLAPIVWVGDIGFINWQMKFPTLTSSGTSGLFRLIVPDLKDFPSQRCGIMHQLNVLGPVILQIIGAAPTTSAEFQVTMVLTQNAQVVLRAQVSPTLLNYV